MPRYRTLDQHIVWKGVMLEPGTEVTVAPEDEPVWEHLVDIKVAEKVKKTPPARRQPASSE